VEVYAASRLQEIISKHYEIGELVSHKRLLLGYENTTYVIETVINDRRNSYCLRKYKEGRKEAEVQFEHSVINHLIKRDFELVARVVNTKDGKSYLKQFEDRDNNGEDIFYAIFDLLPGEDKYTWVSPACNDGELIDAAAVLARFHNTVFGLNPEGKRYEPKIIDLLPVIAENVEKRAKEDGGTEFDTYFLENLSLILKTINCVRSAISEKEYEEMVQQVIHCDYHPGNLKFQNSKIPGLFDFDWSKVDARCFDVALAIMYFCIAWEGKEDGHLQLNKASTFLSAYQKALKHSQGVRPLSDIELKYLPHLINAGNIYILNWAIEDFYSKEADPHEYLIYLQHIIHIMRWFYNKDNWDNLGKMMAKSAVAPSSPRLR